MGTEVYLGMPPPNVVAWIEAKKAKTYVKYTAASGLADWERDIVGTLTSSSIPNTSSIAEVVIGSHVTSIGAYAFNRGCSSLTSVTIPDSVTSIGYGAFQSCSSLMNVTFSGKTKATVQGISGYRWDLPSGCVIHCTDGDITI